MIIKHKRFVVIVASLLVLLLSSGVLASDLKIGINNYLRGIYSLDILERFAVYTAEALDMETVVVNNEGKDEKAISDLENMIASGVDGIVFFGTTDNLFSVVANKCRQAGVPFVFYDHLPSDRSLDYLLQNPYYAGSVGERDYNAGYPIGEYAADAGLKRAIIITSQRGDTTHEARVRGFTDAFEGAGGEVLDVGWGPSSRTEAMEVTENLILANQDIDVVYASNGDYGIGALQMLKKYSNVDAELYVTDLDRDVLTALRDQEIVASNGAHWINSGFAVTLLHNWLLDNKLLTEDGEPPIVEVPILVLPNTLVEAYQKYWLDEEPFSAEEMRQMSYKWNKDVSLADFERAMEEYSFENRLRQKYEEGKISAEEFESFGF
ncbi:MAG TPA: sugar ABC transporter substrate-binding protein [Halanaerobiales bacterium]|nr:sugar ABC transporter substrate-binding protein [Halanaerobiales bacterium]